MALAEAALVRHYRRLVRLAYLALPADRDRHSRVLAAHTAVQHALPYRRTRPVDPAGAPDEPGAPGADPVDGGTAKDGTADGGDPLYDALRLTVLRAALRPRPAGRLLAPRVWGLRLFTPTGGEEDAALDRALAETGAPVRAAFALLAVEGIAPGRAAAVLQRAGVDHPDGAVDRAARLLAEHGSAADAGGTAAGPAAFDPCAVRVQPTDLIRRRRTLGAVLAVAALALTTTAAVLGAPADDRAPAARALPVPPAGDAAGPAGAATTDPARLVRVAADRWRRTARIDLSAWPARGDRLADAALLGRALTAWAQPGPQRRAEPGTVAAPPAGPPQLLFAGTVDGAAVVVLFDGRTLARWTDGRGGGLDLARADGSSVTTAAVVLRRRGATARYLLAPWVEAADSRRLDQPDSPARPVDRSDGVTAALSAPDTAPAVSPTARPTGTSAASPPGAPAVPPAAGPGTATCQGDTVLQLRSSPAIAEKHAFLLADVGGLLPAHLTYTPPPDRTQPAGSPREAVGPDALRAWARAGCAAPDGTPGVRQVNLWTFAVQQLPQNAGTAAWVCLRADRWDGEGSAATAVLLPGARTAQRTGGGPGRACSRFEQDTVGWTWWRSPQGTEYLLAAGSRRTARIAVKGPDWSADRPAPDRAVAVERPARSAVTVEAVLDGGARIAPPR
ncbi:hypothetical protein ACFVYP_09390 [Kitasatospora sp. NPDC058201]|uniref:hypothetical protein n=1 Tax=unclassified Kitasatospora TaxID=2633591 RepID=UPI00365B4D5F